MSIRKVSETLFQFPYFVRFRFIYLGLLRKINVILVQTGFSQKLKLKVNRQFVNVVGSNRKFLRLGFNFFIWEVAFSLFGLLIKINVIYKLGFSQKAHVELD